MILTERILTRPERTADSATLDGSPSGRIECNPVECGFEFLCVLAASDE
jgi:hypothetical protein